MSVISGCGFSEEKEAAQAPDFEVYNEERFSAILYDLTLAEAVFRLNMANPEALEKKGDVLNQILANHQTDSLTFNQNWNYYGGEPERMAEVYDAVTRRVDEEKKKWLPAAPADDKLNTK